MPFGHRGGVGVQVTVGVHVAVFVGVAGPLPAQLPELYRRRK